VTPTVAGWLFADVVLRIETRIAKLVHVAGYRSTAARSLSVP
jgi:hypothetical protein